MGGDVSEIEEALVVGTVIVLVRLVARILEVGDFDVEAQDFEVAIRPMIKLISGADPLQRIERYVRSQEVGLAVPDGADE